MDLNWGKWGLQMFVRVLLWLQGWVVKHNKRNCYHSAVPWTWLIDKNRFPRVKELVSQGYRNKPLLFSVAQRLCCVVTTSVHCNQGCKWRSHAGSKCTLQEYRHVHHDAMSFTLHSPISHQDKIQSLKCNRPVGVIKIRTWLALLECRSLCCLFYFACQLQPKCFSSSGLPQLLDSSISLVRPKDQLKGKKIEVQKRGCASTVESSVECLAQVPSVFQEIWGEKISNVKVNEDKIHTSNFIGLTSRPKGTETEAPIEEHTCNKCL